MTYIRLQKDSDGIVELIFDQPGKAVNTMGRDYDVAMRSAVAELVDMVAEGEVKGVYVRSCKPQQFFAGGDIKEMLAMDLTPSAEEKTKMYEGIMATKAPLRQLETLGVPVAVGINGPALGGGFEIALACHYRVAISGVQLGLPEAMIGLMPGAGGVVRMTYLLGMQEAIGLISQGRRLKANKALEKGLLHELADDEADMHAKAKAWIKLNSGAKQPWDEEGYAMPGGGPDDAANQGLTFFGPANVMVQTKNLMPAQNAIFACVVDSARVDFDTAQKIEGRYFLSLLLDQTARNMMTAFFVQMEALNNGVSRPNITERFKCKQLGIIGAGQMGAGIATAAAQKGIRVVLKDMNEENADKGLSYAQAFFAKGVKKGKLSETQALEYMSRIKPTAEYADLADCDMVIEAVFEDRGVKAAVTEECEAVMKDGSVFASNTSALPISELAQASKNADRFIGMHFFSPAEKMPLVEIVCGVKTSDESLAKAFDLAQQLGKTPIVVNDGPGFFTTRVISKTVTQGASMLEEGVNPVLIESAARDNGSPVGPLAAIDEISQETAYKNGQQAKADAVAQGKQWQDNAASRILDRMVNEFGRRGKIHGGGYYEYPASGKKYLWPGLKAAFSAADYTEIPYQDIKDRLTFSQCLEAVRAMEEGVIKNVGDGNMGSIMGIGFPAQTGGVFQAINAYGLNDFIQRAQDLELRYGSDFNVPALLLSRAELDESFH
ncbi:Fatty acid oxidation complex subunit alpha [Zhongshania aliphaticivorans]|uniref:Fatty acid oxidation complex subunit alpha n=1 Tax=Zhongshania aliphaticivorans TaxID=1470434 RepID=A0A5S9NBD1_9GAMM|nr:3-hydroxyacyl-CoA dehydrogenase NAD-binding domain-containing protein [Zhongshania aliphaticivorans]CAA0087501.1 Fatty acid oxidation complex subunit alpha [Zhongshania aliphaticivorans]CAA0115006.1 Fatty acid oxidation complex subunit alpha [Zhongshania aliphaticivorans]CAA0119812.1 Fatty acid oxidation complex subunit alpha [Zhongshania aliphaticivorans]